MYLYLYLRFDLPKNWATSQVQLKFEQDIVFHLCTCNIEILGFARYYNQSTVTTRMTGSIYTS